MKKHNQLIAIQQIIIDSIFLIQSVFVQNIINHRKDNQNNNAGGQTANGSKII